MTSFINQFNKVDDIFFIILWMSVALLVLITSAMVIFLVKFNRKRNPVAKDIESNLALEILWIVIPTVLVLVMFYYGWAGFRIMRNPPADSMPVKVSAKMWSWTFTYENGKTAGELRVPGNKPVKLIITSEDVIHGLFIPAFRVKEDAVPGMETYLWFLPDKTGAYDLFCSEYCGVKHHEMISKVIVMPQEEFSVWYEKKESAEVSDALKIMKNSGCLDCHSLNGTVEVGPGFKGMFGSKELVITDGKEREITVDEAYLRKSILEPDADILKGFDAVMPPQDGVFSDEELKMIVEHIKGLK